MDEGAAVEDEVNFDLPTGRKTYLSNLIPIRNGEGRIHRIVGIGHDITERKMRQRQVELLSFALNELRDAVFVTDNDSHLLYVNAAACRVLGYHRKDLLRMSVLDIDPGMTQERLAVNRLHSDPFDTHLLETHLKTKDGRLFPVELDVTAFEYDGVRFFFLVARDITERKRAEEELRAHQRKLSDMAVELSLAEERERRRIATELHDRIGQTMLLGKMKFDALAKGLGPSADEGMVDDIRLLLNEVVHDVRTLTQQLHPPMLAGAGLGPSLEWLGRRVEVDYGLRVEVVDDKSVKPLSEELRSVVYQSARELLINVAKHADTGSARLMIGRDGHHLMLVVEDGGRGFDLLADSAKGAVESGYGLFSIRERITYLGGKVTVQSAPGHGTRVSLRVPLKLDEPQALNS
jgi:PAS domain S-box-containing protein